jgi:hypothetical protein
MRLLLILVLFISSLETYSQRYRTISLLGSYQLFDQQAVSFGAEYQINAIWPKVNFESYVEIKLRGNMFFTDSGIENIFGIRSTVYWSNKFAGVGLDSRLILQDKRHRADIGPAIKIGYKYIWLEYSLNYLIGNNFLNGDSDLSTIEFNEFEHNLNLTLSIPIIRIKE